MDKETILICNKDSCQMRGECFLARTHKYGCLIREHNGVVVAAWLTGRCHRRGKLIPWEDYRARDM